MFMKIHFQKREHKLSEEALRKIYIPFLRKIQIKFKINLHEFQDTFFVFKLSSIYLIQKVIIRSTGG